MSKISKHWIIQGDVIAGLRLIPDNNIQCVVTSPPYWGLRDYGTATWEGGDPECDHLEIFKKGLSSGLRNDGRKHKGLYEGEKATEIKRQYKEVCANCGARRIDRQIGLEKTPDEYVQKMVEVFREVRRVMRDDGTLWLNLGDSYAGGGGASGHTSETKNLGRNTKGYGAVSTGGYVPSGLKPKDLCMIPFRVAMALQADGWFLRSVIPWLKRNSMPESVTDRPSSAVEYIFLLTKKARYFYDADAVRNEYNKNSISSYNYEFGHGKAARINKSPSVGNGNGHSAKMNPAGRNRRNSDWFFKSWQGLWQEGEDPLAMIVNTKPFREAHFATFAENMVEPCIKAGTSERGCCPACGAPWEQKFEIVEHVGHKERIDEKRFKCGSGEHYSNIKNFEGWQPTCTCGADETAPCVVLDPFMGSGTVAVVARNLNRSSTGIELNPEYIEIIKKRLQVDSQIDNRLVSYQFEQV